MKLRLLLSLTALAMVAACGGSNPASSVDVGMGSLTGAGATFPEPFYSKAFYLYNQAHPQVSVNYQAVGSGAGIQQFTKGTVDFGASDVPMQAADIATAGGDGSLVQVPATPGAIGYVELAYVVQTGMQQAFLKNRNGKFVQASVAGATAAAAQNGDVSPENFSITDEPGDSTYPIAGFSWIIVRTSILEAVK